MTGDEEGEATSELLVSLLRRLMGDFELERRGRLDLVDLKIVLSFLIDFGFWNKCASKWDWICFFGERKMQNFVLRIGAMRKLLNMS